MFNLIEQVVELYAQGLSIKAVADELEIGVKLTSDILHARVPDLVRARKGKRGVTPSWFQQGHGQGKGRCQLCEILLEEVGDDPKARYCHWCREEGWVELMEDRARERAVTTDHGGDIT